MNIYIYIIIVLFIFGCTNKGESRKVKLNDSVSKIELETDRFISNRKKIDSKEVDVFDLEEEERGIDQGALFYQTNDFNVLQILRFATIGKKEVFFFIESGKINHITVKDFEYNHPYYIPESKIIRTFKKDYFLINDSLALIKMDGEKMIIQDSMVNEFESLKRSGELYISKLRR